ncbi:MAG: sigma-70 family RNA polymerase sigma factor [Actinomycetota bacterium]
MDRDAFEELWTMFFPAVTRTAYLILGDAEEARDVAQDAFVRAFQHWRKVSGLDRPEAWVHRVATNLAISAARRRRPARAEPEPSSPGPEPPDAELLAALTALTPSQRAVIALRYHLDWSIEDTARALGKRPGTVRALTHQGMERLRRDLPREPLDG